MGDCPSWARHNLDSLEVTIHREIRKDVQIKLEILKIKIPYQQSSLATGAHLTPGLFPLSCS
jgi:hypothetical protein